MKEMLLGFGGDYYYVTVSEKAIERLPQEYQKRDSFFKTVTLYKEECIDGRVIALAKEMKADFYNHSERKGFRIIGWDETKVIPVFMEVEYEEGWGEEKLRFISIEDANEWEIEQGCIKTYCNGEDLMMGKCHYNFVDYTPTEILVVKNEDGHKIQEPTETVFSKSDEANHNKELAKFIDNTKPLKISKGTVLSINPLSYYNMLQGNNWTSFHNIDK